ncbi:glycoside hydrolase family 25 protein [Pontibacter sp. E15-1]|uniref:glycoside hydrolase family 25 protein n=1 Tax=Pontibacter sp. E15-1 TaxID=2919918 RepID=UPI001F4FC6F8|nr:GH25 family lysozyme [Pontibacter sp. E15-1]MCJ8163471.1 glycoside hydrolase family 25 protein [Pontibacter sp. E15-1]
MGIPSNQPAKRVPRPKAQAKPLPKQLVKPKARPKKKQKKPVPYGFWIGLAALATLALVVLYVEFFVDKPVPVWPEGHTVYGVDVSHYQREIDWQQVRENEVSFAFVKATEGKSLKDKWFADNWEGAGAVGIVRGAYHFYLPYVQPEKQAENFISMVKLTSGDLPPVLDVEVRGRRPVAVLRRDLKVWLQQVEAAYGVKPIIYTNYTYYKDYLAGHFDGYPLWIAHYKVPKLLLEKSDTLKLAFWQHTDGGAIKGIEGAVDCNVFYGSMRELRSVCIP